MATQTTNFSSFVTVSCSASAQEALVLISGAFERKEISLFQKYFPSWSSQAEENRKTWRAFIASAEDVYGRERVARICKQYFIDVKKMISSGRAFTKKYVELIQYGASEIHVSDIENGSYCKAKWQTLEEIHDKIRSLNPFPVTSSELSATSIMGNLSAPYRFFFYSPRQMGKERSTLVRDCHQRNTHHTALERMTKVLSSKELSIGSIVPVTGPQGCPDYYYVYKKICKEGLLAYGLKPLSAYSHLRPMVIFRSTQINTYGEDNIQTWINDLEPSIGKTGYEAAKGDLQSLLQDLDFCPEGKKVDLAGYSLGGVHAQRTMVDNWQHIGALTTFNAPGIDHQTAEAFAQLINAESSIGPRAPNFSITIYRTAQDLAHEVGEKHLGHGVRHSLISREVIELDFVSKRMTTHLSVGERMRLHAKRFFDTHEPEFVASRYAVQEGIDEQLDNSRRGEEVKFLERTRIVLGSYMLYPILFMIHKVSTVAHVYFGFSLFRYSKERKSLISLVQESTPNMSGIYRTITCRS